MRRMSVHEIADDDIVASHAAGEANERPPLVVLEPLIEFLDAAGIGEGELEIAPIGEGHSNVTYAVTRGEASFILRRPPRGPLPPSAHDVLREARVIGALGPTAARVPKVLAVGDDEAIIGAPFFIMEHVDGEVIGSEMPPIFDNPAQRQKLGEELIDSLVELHSVDWEAAGLEGFGKPTGYLERQLRRFGGLWEHNRTRELEDVDTVGKWLAANMPESGPATIVHGDYRLGNVIYAAESPTKLEAILDWEMATIGDPLADLGYFATLYVDRDDPPLGMFELNSMTRDEGFPLRADLIARYEERSGRAMSDIRWYQTLALWKTVVFMEGNYKRALAGSTDDPFLAQFGDGVVELASRARALSDGA
jgi:aminoglycoside phosphotransferase (APT) family kinase protein